uniref:Uncharacterized protein n=1 Tax=Steinernema glaseri TaxID=37863 RepID=A0A1I8A8D4_9BILA
MVCQDVLSADKQRVTTSCRLWSGKIRLVSLSKLFFIDYIDDDLCKEILLDCVFVLLASSKTERKSCFRKRGPQRSRKHTVRSPFSGSNCLDSFVTADELEWVDGGATLGRFLYVLAISVARTA